MSKKLVTAEKEHIANWIFLAKSKSSGSISNNDDDDDKKVIELLFSPAAVVEIEEEEIIKSSIKTAIIPGTFRDTIEGLFLSGGRMHSFVNNPANRDKEVYRNVNCISCTAIPAKKVVKPKQSSL